MQNTQKNLCEPFYWLATYRQVSSNFQNFISKVANHNVFFLTGKYVAEISILLQIF